MEMFPIKALLLCHVKKYISIEPGQAKRKPCTELMKVKSVGSVLPVNKPLWTRYYHSHTHPTLFQR